MVDQLLDSMDLEREKGITIKAQAVTLKYKAKNGETYEIKELFEAYMTFGGMPSLTEVPLELDKALTILDGIYSSVVGF